MSQAGLPPNVLPPEITELIIDLLISASPFNCSDILALSTLSFVSHTFRHFANKHKFGTVLFHQREVPTRRVHQLRDLLYSKTWSEVFGVAAYVRTLAISLGVRGGTDIVVPHPTLEDGSMAEVLGAIFQKRIPAISDEYCLVLSIHMSQRSSSTGNAQHASGKFQWSSLREDFTTAIWELCTNSHLTTLHLEWLKNFPLDLVLESSVVKHLDIVDVMFIPGKCIKTDFMDPQPALQALSLNSCSSLMDSIDPKYFIRLGDSYTISGLIGLFSKCLSNVLLLEELVVDIPSTILLQLFSGLSRSEATIPPKLTRLTVALDIFPETPRRPQQPISPQLIEILCPYLPQINDLKIVLRNCRAYKASQVDNSMSELLLTIDPEPLDACLAASMNNPTKCIIMEASTLFRPVPQIKFDSKMYEAGAVAYLRKRFHRTAAMLEERFKIIVDATEL